MGETVRGEGRTSGYQVGNLRFSNGSEKEILFILGPLPYNCLLFYNQSDNQVVSVPRKGLYWGPGRGMYERGVM